MEIRGGEVALGLLLSRSVRRILAIAAAFALAAVAASCGAPVVSDVNVVPTATPTADASPTPARYHPDGFADPTMHGPEALTHAQPCEGCHGQNLDGGAVGISCDSCHPQGWRQNCTFCHGGTSDTTGAPPRDIDGNADPLTITFKAHSVHVNAGADHVAYDCTQCHLKPMDAMDPGHWYDNTPGVSEIDFTGGTSDTGVYDGGASCETYCHSTGRGVNGVSHDTDPPATCDSCHNSSATNAAGLDTMSGFHKTHMTTAIGGAIKCSECHGDTVDANGAITDPTKHIDGLREIKFTTSNMVMNALACEGQCHTKDHYATTFKWNGNGAYHPNGFADAAVHGLEMKEQVQDCRVCHGADLTGGSVGVSCDGCHTPGWRSTCTFCHGGTDTMTGAPPRDIDGQTNTAMLSFKAHTAHTTASDHPAYDCIQCHKKPTDVLTPGHNFDGSKGKAEVTFTGGLSAMGTYNGGGSCSGLYCHGDGKSNNGAWTDNSGKPGCSSCHPYLDTPAKWPNMSGFHQKHLSSGTNIVCADCHNATVNAGGTIVDATKHVDGAKEIKFSVATISINGTVCSGTCHNQNHAYDWFGSGAYHPAGWEAAAVHGIAAKTQTQDCRTCHGADLQGGTSGVSCDSCHTPGWRTNCTFCHGGTANSTGAPPRDIDNTTTNLTFAPHTKHVMQGTNHVAFDCKQCHQKPADVLTPNHMFDLSPGKAEVVFTAGLSPAATYDGTTCSTNYCHGNGQAANGTIAKTTTGPLGCGSCHATRPSSGRHGKHSNYACSECHGKTMKTNSSTLIADLTLHINGQKDTFFASGMNFNASTKRCTGTCHNENHSNQSW